MKRTMVKPDVKGGDWELHRTKLPYEYHLDSPAQPSERVATLTLCEREDALLLSQAKNLAEYLERKWTQHNSVCEAYPDIVPEIHLKERAEIEGLLESAGYKFIDSN